MRKLPSIVSAIVSLASVLSLTGCWDNKDINHRSLPVVMGIAKQEDDYQITLQIPQPIENRLRIRVYEEKGKTITQAVDRMSEDMESQIDLLQLKVILIDKKLAAQGLEDVFSYFMRVRDISPKALVVLSDENPRDFFANAVNKEKSEGNNMNDFFEKYAGWNPQIALTRVWEVYRSIHSYTRDVVLPIVKHGRTTAIEHLGSAIIKNGKMVGQISSDDTLLFNMFKGESGQGKIEVMDHASVLITNTSLKLRSRMSSGEEPKSSARLTLKVSLMEVRGGASKELIKQELRNMVERRFRRIFTQAQSSKADIFAIGQTYRTKIPRPRMKDWRETYYPRLRLDFDVRVIIQNEGYLRTS